VLQVFLGCPALAARMFPAKYARRHVHKLASSACRDPTRTDRTNAGENRILSLIGINGLELQMRNALSHG
jgi:hypothetical protein